MLYVSKTDRFQRGFIVCHFKLTLLLKIHPEILNRGKIRFHANALTHHMEQHAI